MIKKAEISQMFLSVAKMFKEKSAFLSEIDSRFGDGDHGITINKISLLIYESAENWKEKSIHQFLEELGEGIMAVNGGSAGPLYGTMVGGLALPLDEACTEIDAEMIKKMLRSSLSEMQDITTAKVGDKTMMDALIPAVEQAERCTGDIPEILKIAQKSAAAGAEKSKDFVSKFGRAKSYKEQTIGTIDAGAMSTAIFFEGLAQPFNVQ